MRQQSGDQTCGGAREEAAERSGDIGRETFSNATLRSSGVRIATRRRKGTITAQRRIEVDGFSATKSMVAMKKRATVLRMKIMLPDYDNSLFT